MYLHFLENIQGALVFDMHIPHGGSKWTGELGYGAYIATDAKLSMQHLFTCTFLIYKKIMKTSVLPPVSSSLPLEFLKRISPVVI